MRAVFVPAGRQRRAEGYPGLRGWVVVRLLVVAAAVMVFMQGPLGAAEVVRVPVSCAGHGSRVELAPAAGEEMLAIVGGHEHKTFRLCTFGRCRSLEVHRFEVMCGGRQVSWRLIAGQLLDFTPGPLRRDPLSGPRLRWWEAQALLAEPEFAPVDELGARILAVADNPMPKRVADADAPFRKPIREAGLETGTEAAKAGAARPDPRPESQNWESQKSESQKPESQKLEPAAPEALAPGSASAQSAPPAVGAPPRGAGPSMPLPDPVTRDGDARLEGARLEATRLEATRLQGTRVADAGPAAAGVAPPADNAGRGAQPLPNSLASAAAAALALIIAMMATVAAFRWLVRRLWRMMTRGLITPRLRPPGEPEEPPEPDDGREAARACRELMREVTRELVDAMAVVNGLNEVPALQAALRTELDSIRRSMGFTQSGRSRPGDTDFIRMRAELALSLQAIRRIVDIAAAAGTSFSAVPADVIITTRPQAYAFLGVNASASEAVLKKAVNALRRCWHPDLATDEDDRRIREERIKQINAAWDVITGKHMPA